MTNNLFTTLVAQYMEELTLYVPIVKRVHGPTHPEFIKVAAQFQSIAAKLQQHNYDLANEFLTLREITNNYVVPSDVCETYSAVYTMLAKLDQAYKEVNT